MNKHWKMCLRCILVLALTLICFGRGATTVYATTGIVDAVTQEEEESESATSNDSDDSDEEDTSNLISIGIAAGDGSDLASVLEMLLVLTVISLAPSILIMLTSFTRIVIVLHFVRTAMGTQTVPPNQVLTSLALFLTFFIMMPTFTTIYNDAIVPLQEETITVEEAWDAGVKPLREFMIKQTPDSDIKTFVDLAQLENVEDYDDIPLLVLIPSFMISELRSAFIMGFLIYLPFIIIDMVVASTLMSMGMMMLAPTVISLPFKILLFVMVDGWNLVVTNLVSTFY
ncbi:MAG: flagellar type III secretion system pore protein FliP [Lachnospiraceae bacterium]|nr:flagellar type III secretion system pore protein FliP [Lachnospiraceae bacterium]